MLDDLVTFASVVLRAGAVVFAWGLLFHYRDKAFLFLLAVLMLLFFRQLVLAERIETDWLGLVISAGLVGMLLMLQRVLEQERQIRLELVHELDERERWLAARAHFIRDAQHQLRTPIHTLIGYTELLCQEELSLKQQLFCARLRRAGRTLAHVVQRLPAVEPENDHG